MRAALLSPAFHFLLLGGLWFSVEQWRLQPTPETWPIVIDADDRAKLAADWQSETGRAPTDAERRASVHQHVKEQRLLREALRIGLAEDDVVVRERLVSNLRFLQPDDPRGDEQLFREAMVLGMAEHDVVARRRLIQIMAQQLTGDVAVDPIALQRYIARHPERYGQPPRFKLRQVFITGDATPDRALKLRQALSAGSDASDVAGDPFLLASLPEWISEAELRRLFGPAMADAVAVAETGVWSAPLRSAWGWHLVRVDARTSDAFQASADLRQRAAYAWLAEREQQLVRQSMQTLASRYPLATTGATLP